MASTVPCGSVGSHGAGAPDQIVTREMREAGASVVEQLSGVVSPSGLAEAIYIAMVTVPSCATEPRGRRK